MGVGVRVLDRTYGREGTNTREVSRPAPYTDRCFGPREEENLLRSVWPPKTSENPVASNEDFSPAKSSIRFIQNSLSFFHPSKPSEFKLDNLEGCAYILSFHVYINIPASIHSRDKYERGVCEMYCGLR